MNNEELLKAVEATDNANIPALRPGDQVKVTTTLPALGTGSSGSSSSGFGSGRLGGGAGGFGGGGGVGGAGGLGGRTIARFGG